MQAGTTFVPGSWPLLWPHSRLIYILNTISARFCQDYCKGAETLSISYTWASGQGSLTLSWDSRTHLTDTYQPTWQSESSTYPPQRSSVGNTITGPRINLLWSDDLAPWTSPAASDQASSFNKWIGCKAWPLYRSSGTTQLDTCLIPCSTPRTMNHSHWNFDIYSTFLS